jgi:hypothetical protein
MLEGRVNDTQEELMIIEYLKELPIALLMSVAGFFGGLAGSYFADMIREKRRSATGYKIGEKGDEYQGNEREPELIRILNQILGLFHVVFPYRLQKYPKKGKTENPEKPAPAGVSAPSSHSSNLTPMR